MDLGLVLETRSLESCDARLGAAQGRWADGSPALTPCVPPSQVQRRAPATQSTSLLPDGIGKRALIACVARGATLVSNSIDIYIYNMCGWHIFDDGILSSFFKH